MAKNVASIGRGPFDKVIRDGFAARKSPEEIATEPPISGMMSPFEVLKRGKEIIAAKDALDFEEYLALALEDAYALRTQLRKQMDDAGYVDANTANAMIRANEALVKQIKDAQVGMGDLILRFNEVRATELVQALTFITGQMFAKMDELGMNHDGVEEIVLEAIEGAIPEVSGE